MKTELKAKLRKNHFSYDPSDYNAHIVVNGNLGIVEVIDELLKENNDIDRETAISIISAFNRKAAELVVSGYNVNTGLVKLSPIIQGSLYDKKWNPNINHIDVSLKNGYDLSKALNDSDIQIVVEPTSEVLEQESINSSKKAQDNTL